MANFADLMNMEVEKAEPPPVRPAGTWDLMIVGYDDTVVSSQKETPGIEVEFKMLAAGADVDQDELEEWEEQTDKDRRTISDTFWTTEKSMFMLRRFIEATGVPIGGKTFKQVLPELPGNSVKAYIVKKPRRGPGQQGQFYNEIANYMPVED